MHFLISLHTSVLHEDRIFLLVKAAVWLCSRIQVKLFWRILKRVLSEALRAEQFVEEDRIVGLARIHVVVIDTHLKSVFTVVLM